MMEENLPRIFAHRGASGTYFENTMEAFRGAAEQQADGIELDVQKSLDDVFFVIHDPDLARLAGIRRRIAGMESAEIDRVRIGKRFTRKLKGYRIPRLSEVISFSLLNGMALNIELKETISEQPACLPGLLDQLSVLDDYHISSFDYALIEQAKALDSGLECAFLLKKASLKGRDLADYPAADAFHFHKRLLTDEYMDLWTTTDKIIRLYGIDGSESFLQEPPAFAAGWITDYPDRFRT